MAEEDKKKTASAKRITDEQRFHFIGFDVFPGKGRDLFKSDAEKNQWVDGVKAKRNSGQVIRDECTLTEARVSGLDRIVMAIACLVMIFSVFIPWFAVYNEVEEKPAAARREMPVADSLAMKNDSVAMAAMAGGDSLAMAASETAANTDQMPSGTAEQAPIGEADSAALAATAHERPTEEVLHGYVAQKRMTKVYERLAGLGAFASLGTVGSAVFSSGGILVISAILFLLMIVSTLALPIYSLYGLFGLKGDVDQKALALKKVLKLNWIPLLLFVGTMILAFFGANYGFDAESAFTSLGRSYGVGVFLDTLSWGAFVSIGASVLLAVKGIEI